MVNADDPDDGAIPAETDDGAIPAETEVKSPEDGVTIWNDGY